MRALVTGSSGFVGRHLVRALRERGDHVVGVDVEPSETTNWTLDARDFFRQVDPLRPFDVAFHCAAFVGGRAAIDGAPLELAVDFELDAAFARWAARGNTGRAVYFSSSAAYPVIFQRAEDHLPLDEGLVTENDSVSILAPDAIYGWIKLTGEQLMGHLEAAGVPVTVLRPFSGYGGDQDLDYPFPSFIQRAREKADPFTIWGPGTQVRDWIHIDDVVGATLAAVERKIPGPLNLGTGIPTSFFTLANMVTTAAGYMPELKAAEDMPTGVHWRVADTTRMREVYLPRVSLEEGIERALAGR